MVENLHDADTGGPSLVFASDASGIRFRLTEVQLYEAEEVAEELGNGADGPPEFGRWLRIEVQDEEAWLVAPGELIEELQDLEAEAGELFEVSRCQKSGTHETDPYEVNLSRLGDDKQTRL